MEFRILGPLEVQDGDRLLPLGGAKQRAALAILLLHPNEVVSREHLIDGLWGASPPVTAGHTLDTYMSRLRRALGSQGDGPRVLSRRPGYELRLEDGELDLQRFELLLEEGRQARAVGNQKMAAELLREALGLFRGPALDDLAHAGFVEAEAGRLDELPLAALEERIEADLALGRHLEMLPELQGLVAKHPFRERFWEQLMLALYRSGRQADALAAFERARQRLGDDLGVDPGRPLQELQQGILRQDPSLDRPVLSRSAASSRDQTQLPDRSETGGGHVAVTATAPPAVSPQLSAPAESRQPPQQPGGHTPRRYLPRRRWVRVVLASGLVLGLTGGLLAGAVRDRHPQVPATIRPGVNLLDARTGEVVAQFPSILAGEIWYADGVFWALTLTPGGTSISFVGIDARTRRVIARFATGLDDVGNYAVLGHDLWVSDFTGPTLLRMDLPSGRIVQRISLARPGTGDTAGAYQVVAGAGSIWVARPDAHEIVRVDAGSGDIQHRYRHPAPGCCLAFGEGRLWFDREGGVTWIDPRTGEVGPLARVAGADVTVGGGFAWTANMETGTAYKVSPDGKAVATYATGEGADKVSYDDGTVWVANDDAATITAIDAVTGARRSYPMGRVVGALASGDGVVAVMVLDQRSYDDVLAALKGNVARILLPAYFTTTQEPAVTDLQLNPLMAQIEQATCAKLLNYPDGSGTNGWHLQPEVAASMPAVSDGGRTYTFTIRPGYRFSPPSNQPVTAEVFRYSIERSLSPRLGSGAPGPGAIGDIAGEPAFRAGTAEHISGLRAVGDQLVISLTRPSPDFLERLSLPYFCPVPTDTPIVAGGLQAVAPPSAGPYYMALPRNTGEFMILKRNPNYTGPRPHFFDAFAIREGIDPGEAVGRVEHGTWDAVSEVNQHVAEPPVMDDPLFVPGGALDGKWESTGSSGGSPHYQATALPSVDYFAFNSSRPIFTERRARLAVAWALNRSVLAALRGQVSTDQLLPPAMGGLEGQSPYPLAGPDLQRARALLGPGRHVAVMAVHAECDQCLRVAQAVKAQLRPIGIEIRIKEMLNVSPRTLNRAPVDLVERVTELPYPDGASFLAAMLGGDVPSKWLPAGVRAKVERLAELGGSARTESAVSLSDDLVQNEAPVTAFAYGSIGELFSARIGCTESQSLGSGVDLASLCLARPPQSP
jgi:DNA-binding SARP family transcriptional activator/ABC-type transport system substrate-binding protein